MGDKIGEVYVDILGNLAPINKDLRGLYSTVQSMGSRISEITRTAFGFAGAQLGIAGVRSAIDKVKTTVFDMNALLETSKLRFEKLTGSADSAAKHIKEMMKFQMATGGNFDMKTILDASKTLMTFGVRPEQHTAELKRLGDVAEDTGASLQELAYNYGRALQAAKQNEPFERVVIQMQNMGAMSSEGAIKLNRLFDEMRKGKDVGGEAFRVVVAEMDKFKGAMDRHAGTWEDLTESVKNKSDMIISQAFKPLFEEAKNVLSGIDSSLTDNEERINAWGEATSKNIIEAVKRMALGTANVLDVIAPALNMAKTGIDGLWDGFQKLPPWVQEVGIMGALFGGKVGLGAVVTAAGAAKLAAEYGENIAAVETEAPELGPAMNRERRRKLLEWKRSRAGAPPAAPGASGIPFDFATYERMESAPPAAGAPPAAPAQTYTQRAQDLIAEIEKASAAGAKLRAEEEAAKKAGDAAAKAKAQRAKEAAKVIEESMGPLTRYNAELARLQDLLTAGDINEDQFAAAVDRARDALEKSTVAMDEHVKAREEWLEKGRAAAEQFKSPEQKYKERMENLKGWRAAGEMPEDAYSRAVKDAEDELKRAKDGTDEWADSFKNLEAVVRDYGKEFKDTLMDAFETGKFKFNDFLKSIYRGLARRGLDQLLGAVLPSVFGASKSEYGNVFYGGQVQSRFASGGILTSPVVFPMARGGVGLAGEAGYEGILPLKWGSKGLGVNAYGGGGGGGTVINIDRLEALDAQTFAQWAGQTNNSRVMWNVTRAGVEGNTPLRATLRRGR